MSFNFEASRMRLPSEINQVRQAAEGQKLQNELLRRSMDAQVEGFDIGNTLNKIKANIDQRNLDYFEKENLSPAEQDSARIQAQHMQAEANVASVQFRVMEFEHSLVALGTESDSRQYSLSRGAMLDAYNMYRLTKEQGGKEEEAIMVGQAHMEKFWPSMEQDFRVNFDPVLGAAIERSNTENTRVLKDWREQFGAKPGEGMRWFYNEDDALRQYITDPNSGEPFKQVRVEGGTRDMETPTDAARTASLVSAKTTLANAANMIMRENQDGTFTINRAMIASMNLGIGPGREARVYMRNSIEARLRAETGATAPEAEVERAELRMMPSNFDSDFTIAAKFTVFDMWLDQALTNIYPDVDPSQYQAQYDRAITELDALLNRELRRREGGAPRPTVVEAERIPD